MIVNQLKSGWEVIFQRAHEMLAMQIASHWQKNQRPSRWAELLSAIAEHDNRQEGWGDGRHLTPAGAPMDFTQKGFSLEQARGVTSVSRFKSRYVGLMISMHTSYLYEPLRGSSKETDQFLDEQVQNQQQWRQSLSMSKEDAGRDYALMHWADRCSLILCKNQLPPDERKLEVFQDPQGRSHYILQRSNGSLSVEPWPFEEEEVSVWVESRLLNQLQYKSDEELAQALEKAEIKEKSWKFRK